MPYTAGESDVVSFFEGLEVDSVHVPMAAEDSPRAGSCKGEWTQWLDRKTKEGRKLVAASGDAHARLPV